MSNQAQSFLDLCAIIIERKGFIVSKEVKYLSSYYIDLIAEKRGQEKKIFEVKIIRENPATLSTIRNAVSQLNTYLVGVTHNPNNHIVMLSCEVSEEHEKWIEQEYKVSIWDRSRLLSESSESSELRMQFQSLFEQIDQTESRRVTQVRDTLSQPRADIPEEFYDIRDRKFAIKAKEPTGAILGRQLRATPKSKQGAKAYEKIVQEIIEYLFGDFLLDARPQSRTEDNLSILDLIFRVAPGHPFWDTLTRDFRARVIVFECKNYSKPIAPTQLYTTERYISVGALRPVCFLVTRFKPHKHTELAAYGTMREGGKLFVFLDDDDLQHMLNIRDIQSGISQDDKEYFRNDPTILLDQKIYDFLGRMPR